MRQPEKNINRGRLKGSTSAMSAALLYSTSLNSVFVMKQGVLSRDVACPVIGHRKKLKTKCGQPFFYLLTSAPRSLFPVSYSLAPSPIHTAPAVLSANTRTCAVLPTFAQAAVMAAATASAVAAVVNASTVGPAPLIVKP